MPEVHIAASPRTEFGKGAARRSRREGKVPAVLYGHGTDTRHLSLPGHALMLALKTPNVLLRLEGLQRGGDLALPKSVQRDPVRGFLEHVDLILVRSGEKVTVDIPVTITGEVAPDGLLDQQMVQISVEADATRIPPGGIFSNPRHSTSMRHTKRKSHSVVRPHSLAIQRIARRGIMSVGIAAISRIARFK